MRAGKTFKPMDTESPINGIVDFLDPGFPFARWIDRYDDFSDGTLPPHWRNAFEIGLVIHGDVTFAFEEEDLHLHAGDCICITPGSLYMSLQDNTDQHAEMAMITFLPTLFPGGEQGTVFLNCFRPFLMSRIRGFAITPGIAGYATIHDCLTRIHALDSRIETYQLDCLTQLGQVWVSVMRCAKSTHMVSMPARSDNRHMSEAKTMFSYVNKHYGKHIGVDDIAGYAHVSRSSCYRAFARFANKTPLEYINDLRLSQAALLLRQGEMSVSGICKFCGFSTLSYFGKLFHKRYGISPGRYQSSPNRQ